MGLHFSAAFIDHVHSKIHCVLMNSKDGLALVHYPRLKVSRTVILTVLITPVKCNIRSKTCYGLQLF